MKRYVRGLVSPYGVNVSISEMMDGYLEHENWELVVEAEAVVHARKLEIGCPFRFTDPAVRRSTMVRYKCGQWLQCLAFSIELH